MASRRDMGSCAAGTGGASTDAPAAGERAERVGSGAAARVLKKGKPSQCDPTGTGMIVNDILTPWGFPDCDPFILLHEFGPKQGGMGNMPIGMHPHRGFNEVPYLKEGRWIGTDAWKPGSLLAPKPVGTQVG